MHDLREARAAKPNWLRAAAVTSAACLGVFSATALAQASTVELVGGTVTIEGDSGENAHWELDGGATDITVSDTTSDVRPGSGCAVRSSHEVSCRSTLISSIVIQARHTASVSLFDGRSGFIAPPVDYSGGSGPDRINFGSSNELVTARLGAGSDAFIGGPRPDVVAGGSGNDLLVGGAGDDRLLGDDGDDILAGGAGLDLLRGGSGIDRISAIDGERDQIDCGRDASPKLQVDFAPARDTLFNCLF